MGRRALATRQFAARKLHVSMSTVDRMIRRGELPSVMVSRRCRRIPAEALDALLVTAEA